VPDPERVIVAGDWHGDEEWALSVIARLPDLLPDEHPRYVLHAGDYGIWPGIAGRRYRYRVAEALEQAGAVLWFVDGNHEWHPWLQSQHMTPAPDGLWAIDADRQFWMRRGFRWAWHGRTWLALGGGVSLDRAARTEGADWWREEEISDEQERDISVAGPADVILAHDCPAGVAHSFPPPPPWWALADLARNDAHRDRVQRIVSAVRPSHFIHGHLHRAYSRACDFGYGPVSVTGLDRDGEDGNYAVLDVRDMTWEVPGA
jgi:hypothetical protein